MKKLNCFSMYMKKISSVLVIRYFERNQWKDKYVTNKTHWFLVEQNSTDLKNILNICVYKLSFCYFYHGEVLYKT